MSDQANKMPKFDFSKSSIKSDAELELLTAKKGDTSKVFRPGRHEVTIASAIVGGPGTNDPTWTNVEITYQGAGAKSIKDFVLVPTRDIVYGPKKTLYPFQRLQNLLGALGKSLKVDNVGEVLSSVMGNLSALQGMNVAIEVGYQRAHGKMVRNDLGESHVEIVLANKTILAGENGQPLTFPDFGAAEAHAKAANIAFDSFPRILGYATSATPARTLTAVNANW